MDEDIAIINQNTRISLIKNFLKKIQKKYYHLLFIIFINFLLIYFAYENLKKEKK